jgi:hypothetical protein
MPLQPSGSPLTSADERCSLVVTAARSTTTPDTPTQLVVTMSNLRDSSADALKAAIASLRCLLQRLPEIVRPHLSRALRYAHDALRVREAMV